MSNHSDVEIGANSKQVSLVLCQSTLISISKKMDFLKLITTIEFFFKVAERILKLFCTTAQQEKLRACYDNLLERVQGGPMIVFGWVKALFDRGEDQGEGGGGGDPVVLVSVTKLEE